MHRWVPLFLVAALLPWTASASVRLEVGSADVRPGEEVEVPVRLRVTAGEEVAAVTNEIAYDSSVAPSTTLSGNPACRVNDSVEFVLSAFVFTPRHCEPARRECTGMRASILGLLPSAATPDGVVLYSCRFAVAGDASPGLHPLRNSRASYSSQDGIDAVAAAVGGGVRIPGTPSPTLTPSPTQRPPSPTQEIVPAILAPGCTGDCDATGEVSAAEVELLTGALFDTASLAACPSAEPLAAVHVTAAHLVAAARALRLGCAATATQTQTRSEPTATPTSADDTATPTIVGTPPDTPAPEASATRAHTRTPTISPTITRTSRPSATPSRTRVRTPSATSTNTRSRPTMTPTPGRGPRVTFLGIARASGMLLTPTADNDDGVPIFDTPTGTGFKLVVEGAGGLHPVGTTTFTETLTDFPDLQVQVDHDLGNGSARVCGGGVPAIAPPDFSPNDDVAKALNDLGCHFDAGVCVSYSDGTSHFVSPQSSVEFCAVVSTSFRFPPGETKVSARLRDITGVAGDVAQMIVRVPG